MESVSSHPLPQIPSFIKKLIANLLGTNRPVHNFLLRHVYHSSISAFHLSKSTATFITFFLSACVHELVMLCLFKKVRGYLFIMQLGQLPLAALSRTKLLKGRDTLGNLIFWFGLFVGPSLITALYLIV